MKSWSDWVHECRVIAGPRGLKWPAEFEASGQKNRGQWRQLWEDGWEPMDAVERVNRVEIRKGS